MESYKAFVRNNRKVLVGHVLIYAQGLILMPLIIKTVGVSVYGGYILVMTMLGVVYGISSFGVGFKSGRFLPAAEGRDVRRDLFYPQFCFQCLSIAALALAVIVFYPLLEMLFFKGELVFSKWLVFPYLFSYLLFSQATGYFVATHRVSYFMFATVAFPYLNIALIVLTYLLTCRISVNILFFTHILSYLLPTIPMAWVLIREIGLNIPPLKMGELAEDARLGFPLRVNYIMDFLLSSSDRYLITYFMTVAAVGHYSPGYALGSLLLFFPRVSGIVLPPLLSKAIDEGKDAEAFTMLNYTVKGYLLLGFPFVAGAAVMSRSLLRLFANAEVAQQAYLVTPIVALATVFFGLNIILSNALMVRMKTSVLLRMNAFAAVINIALNVIFLAIFKNVLVAAVTTLVGYAAAFIFIRRAVGAEWPLRFEYGAISKSMAASILMGVVLHGISTRLGTMASGIWPMLGQALVGVVVYSLALLAMKTFSEKEWSYVKKAFA